MANVDHLHRTIAILVNKLGGDVTITKEEAQEAYYALEISGDWNLTGSENRLDSSFKLVLTKREKVNG